MILSFLKGHQLNSSDLSNPNSKALGFCGEAPGGNGTQDGILTHTARRGFVGKNFGRSQIESI